MVKESPRDGNLKKKRKTINSQEENDVDVYKKVVEFEEKEALNRSSDGDAETYFETCQIIRQLLAEIGELKIKNTPEARSKIQEKTNEICMRIVVLKKLNRMEKVRLVAPKELLIAEKQKVDSINLQYQNLLYESNHLLSEFKKCFQFKSKDENIELVPINEFFEKAPENLTKKFIDYDEKDEKITHELRLARLEWELQQRIDLAEMCKKLEEEKAKLNENITERKNRLDKLSPLLAKVLDATKPVQEHLNLQVDKIQTEHKLASLLPNSLYLFYANADAYRQVNDNLMQITITGDQDEAIQWQEIQEIDSDLSDQDDANDTLDEEEEEDEEQSETELPEIREVLEVKKRRRHQSNHHDPLQEKKKHLFQIHPLGLEVNVRIKDGPGITMHFKYYTKLQLITVTSQVTIPDNILGMTAREVLSDESIIGELNEGDQGYESPNPCTPFQLKKINLDSFRSLVSELGFAYHWAQRVCGLDYLAKMKKSADVISQINVENVMKAIRKRLKYRYALAGQLELLERNIIPEIPKTVQMPAIAVSNITKWQSINYTDFCQTKFTETFIENELVVSKDLFYKATITRSDATLEAYIVIKHDYPLTPPLIILQLNFNGLHNSNNDDDIRDMERAVNVGWNHGISSANWLLAAQLSYLCVCFDIYLETEDLEKFPQNSMYVRRCCGRNRRKPFRFKNVGVGVFIQ